MTNQGISKAQKAVMAFGAVAIASGALALFLNGETRLATLWIVGALLGFVLYRTAYGFTYSFRAAITERRTAGVRAQILMLALGVLLFFPALSAGAIFGAPVRGFVFPVGLETALGAFIFAVGMQICGACGSGALYTAGGGNTKMVLTLVFLIIGMTIGAYDIERFANWPTLPATSVLQTFGLLPALLINAIVFAGLWLFFRMIEQRRHGNVEAVFSNASASRWGGAWPLAAGAIGLAVLNFATLWIAGRPWGIINAFALWGSQAADAMGIAEPVFWAYWEEPTRADLLHRSLFTDLSTLMNVGLIIGALFAAGLAGRFAPVARIPLGALAGAIIGGLMLGYGGRMALGCNISAYFSGILSGSLHGWVWIAAAVPGTFVGILLRPLFGLPVTWLPKRRNVGQSEPAYNTALTTQ